MRLTSAIALLCLLSTAAASCKTTDASVVLNESGITAANCRATSNPTGDLAKALATVRPLRIKSTRRFATVTPVGPREGLTSQQMLGSQPTASDLSVDGVQVAQIDPSAPLALVRLSFDQDLFTAGQIPSPLRRHAAGR